MLKLKEFGDTLKNVIILPPGIEFYDIDGQIVFPIRRKNEDGTWTTEPDAILYLVADDNKGLKKGHYYKQGILLSNLVRPYVDEFRRNIEENKAKDYNADDGDLGLEG